MRKLNSVQKWRSYRFFNKTKRQIFHFYRNRVIGCFSWQPAQQVHAGLSQLECSPWDHIKTQVTRIRPIRLCIICKCVTCAFGRVRRTRTVRNAVAVTNSQKHRNIGSFLAVQKEQKAEQRNNASKGNEEETNPPFIFRTTHISKKSLWLLSSSN